MKFNIDTPRGAADYLVARIVKQAKDEDVPLSTVEAKMLYFSKNGWNLPDMEAVHDAYERYHDVLEYEPKIIGLIQNIRQFDRRAGNEKSLKAWNHAVRKLGREDRYLLSLISASGQRQRPLVEGMRVVLAALVILGVCLAVAFYIHSQSH